MLTKGLIAQIIAKCAGKFDAQEDGCWVWTGSFNHIAPCVYIGHKRHQVRAAIWENGQGTSFPRGYVPHMVCRNPKCVRFEHIKAMSKAEDMEVLMREGALDARSRYEAILQGKAAQRAKVKPKPEKPTPELPVGHRWHIPSSSIFAMAGADIRSKESSNEPSTVR